MLLMMHEAHLRQDLAAGYMNPYIQSFIRIHVCGEGTVMGCAGKGGAFCCKDITGMSAHRLYWLRKNKWPCAQLLGLLDYQAI